MDVSGYGWVIVATAWILIPLGGMTVGVVMHWLRTKERMLAIEKGVALPPEPRPTRTRDPWEFGRNFRLAGLINIAVGLGLLVLFTALSQTLPEFPKGVIAVSAIPFLIGVALLIEYRIRMRELGPRPSPPA